MKSKKEKKTHQKPTEAISHRSILLELQNNIKKYPFETILLMSGLTIFLIFSLHHLGNFFTADEPLWLYKRGPDFWNNFLNGSFSKTLSRTLTGAFTAIIAGLTSQFIDVSTYVAQHRFADFLFWWRLPNVIINIIALIFISYYLWQLEWPKKTSGIAIFLLSTALPLLGIGQIINPDATLWSFGLLSLLSFISAITHFRKRDVIIAGISLSIACLSKFPASIYYVFFFVIVYFYRLLGFFEQATYKKALQFLAGVYTVSFAVSYTVMPASWNNLTLYGNFTINSSILKPFLPYILIGFGILTFESLYFKNFSINWLKKNPIVLRSIYFIVNIIFLISLLGSSIHELFKLDFISQVSSHEALHFGSTAFFKAFFWSQHTVLGFLGSVVILLYLAFIIGNILKPKFNHPFSKSEIFPVMLHLIIFGYIVGSAMGGYIANSRYQTLIIPLYILMAAYTAITYTRTMKYQRVVVSFICILSFAELVDYSPMYLSYANNLPLHTSQGGPMWGMGGYEVAQFANQLPNAQHLVILSDYTGFNEFFIGHSYRISKPIPENLISKIDYLCLSYQGKHSLEIRNPATLNTWLTSYYEQPGEYIYQPEGPKSRWVKLVKVTK